MTDGPLSVSCQGLFKEFISYKKAPGLKGTFQSFFSPQKIAKRAVHPFDLEIKKGEIVGLLGPNGAGKTTLMKMFTGIIVPSGGELQVVGHVPHAREISFRHKIALVMGQKSQLWWDIPAMDSFLLLKSFYEIPEEQFQERLHHMAKLMQVESLLHIHVRRLSLGERMKLELMAGLLHSPEVIFLDEPTIGLDLIAQERIREFVFEYHTTHNCTILLTSHYMADVEALCERIVLIEGGKKSFDGPIQEFSSLLGHEKSVTLEFGQEISKDHQELFSSYKPIWSEKNDRVELLIPQDDFSQMIPELMQKFSIKGIQTEKTPVERVMKTLMEKQIELSS